MIILRLKEEHFADYKLRYYIFHQYLVTVITFLLTPPLIYKSKIIVGLKSVSTSNDVIQDPYDAPIINLYLNS